MWPLILVLNHVGGQSFNIFSVIISNNVCVIIPTNTLKKIFEQINDSILPFYISKRKKSNKSDKTL